MKMLLDYRTGANNKWAMWDEKTKQLPMTNHTNANVSNTSTKIP